MDAIDGTDHTATHAAGPPTSLLTVIIDTNPYAWALYEKTLPLSQVIANLLVFINAHLAINHANQIVVIASHTTRAQWLYPTPKSANNNVGSRTERGADAQMQNGVLEKEVETDVANKYRPFQQVEEQLLRNLTHLISQTTASDIEGRTTTMIAGAITMALAHIAKQTLLRSPGDASNILNAETVRLPSAGFPVAADSTNTATSRDQATLSSRILILSVSGDLAAQYIPVMNAIFAAQRQRVPIDVLKLAGDTVFLQQACDSTGGIYLDPALYRPPAKDGQTTNGVNETRKSADDRDVANGALQGLLLYLLQPLLADAHARRTLVPPADAAVDFRAACFCHRKIVGVGYVCSVCLSIFCEPLADRTCLTCGTALALPREVGIVPAVLPRTKKKKKKRLGGTLENGTSNNYASSAAGTPGPT